MDISIYEYIWIMTKILFMFSAWIWSIVIIVISVKKADWQSFIVGWVAFAIVLYVLLALTNQPVHLNLY